MWWALVCAADTDSNMGVEMVSVSWCIFVLRSGKEINIFFPFPKDKWSFHTVDDVNNVGLYLWGRAGSCWLCDWGCWRAGVTRGNCPETLGCDLPDISPRCLSRSPSLWTVSPWGKMERGEERLKGGKNRRVRKDGMKIKRWNKVKKHTEQQQMEIEEIKKGM